MIRRLLPLMLCAPLLAGCAMLYSVDYFPMGFRGPIPLDACIVDNPDFPQYVVRESLENVNDRKVFQSLQFLSSVDEGRGRCDLIFSFVHDAGMFLADDTAYVYSGRTGAQLGTVTKTNNGTTFAFLGEVIEAVKPGTTIGDALENERRSEARAQEAQTAAVSARRDAILASLSSAEASRPGPKALLYAYKTALGDAAGELELLEQIRMRLMTSAKNWRPRPTLPEEARQSLLRGQALLKQGASADDAAREFQAAVDAAPWWPDGYFNLGMLRALQHDDRRAIYDLRLYVAASPDGSRAQAAKLKIASLEAGSQSR